jgi:hypothetical protein
MTFLKYGKEARREAAVIDEQRKEADNKVWRFFVKRGGQRKITFLDGELLEGSEGGELSMVTYYEHNLYLNGHWRNFYVCTGNEQEPCPLCEEGKTRSLVAVFTVVDHTEYTDRNGQTHKDQVMLLVAKRQTQKLLEYKAVQHGGLAGVTFNVARMDEDQSAAVGTLFDFVEKNPVEEVYKRYDAKPFKYEEIIKYRTPAELRKMGFGKESGKIGNEPGVSDTVHTEKYPPNITREPGSDDDIGLTIDDMSEEI